jgi:hypothetical protein
MFNQCLGHRTSAGTQFDHGPGRERVHVAAMVRERLARGQTAPVVSGLSSHERMNRTSSRRRDFFATLTEG